MRFIFTAFVLVFISCSATEAPEQPVADAGSEGLFETRAPLSLGPRQECASVILNGEMVVLGGFDDNRNVLDSVEAYTPATNTWRELPSLPLALHHPNALPLMQMDARLFLTPRRTHGHHWRPCLLVVSAAAASRW